MCSHKIWLSLTALTSALHFSAHAEIYQHIDSTGSITYSNVQARGMTAPLQSSETLTRPPATAKTLARPTPASFPKISPGEQRQRDKGVKTILEQEIDEEKTKLQAAKESGNKENLARAQANLEALNRELSNIK